MNKTLIRAAAVINIVAASLIYVACSGDDGADGKSPQCTTVPTTTGVNIVCDGNIVGTLSNGQDGQSAPGTEGTCTVLPGATAGTFNAKCGNETFPLVGSGGNGGCDIQDNPTNSAYLIITCGTVVKELAKAMCGTTPYDPLLWACDYSGAQPVLAEHKCGTVPYNPTVEFCQAGSVKVLPLCGAGKEEYTAAQFCQPVQLNSSSFTDLFDSAAYASFPALVTTNVVVAGTNTAQDGTIQDRCAGKAYASWQFCFANTNVYQKCGTGTTPNALLSGNTKGIEYEADQLCVGGSVQGNCGGLPYAASEQFCQSSGVVKLLCGADIKPLAERKYTADEFCQIISITHSDASASSAFTSPYEAGEAKLDVDSATTLNGLIKTAAKNGKIKSYCVIGNAKTPFLATHFCQGTGTAASAQLLCDGATVASAKEYTSAQFCQHGTGYTTPSGGIQTSPSGVAASSTDALAGKIVNKCGSSASNSYVYGTDYFCTSVGANVAQKPTCRVIAAANGVFKVDAYYDPEVEFCVGPSANTGNASGEIYPTCAPRSSAKGSGTSLHNSYPTKAAAADDYYDVDKQVCETRGSILYDYVQLDSKLWLAENARPNNSSTFTWTDAQNACPGLSNTTVSVEVGPDGAGSPVSPNAAQEAQQIAAAYPSLSGWALPGGKYVTSALAGEWYSLASATGPTAGNAGIELRAKTGWLNVPTNDDYSAFAALPAAVTGISNLPEGNYAYWWTADEGGYTYDTQGNITGAGSNLNFGNYVFIQEDETALGSGGSGKLTTRLSVRCVKN